MNEDEMKYVNALIDALDYYEVWTPLFCAVVVELMDTL